jgi:hypothetical protein
MEAQDRTVMETKIATIHWKMLMPARQLPINGFAHKAGVVAISVWPHAVFSQRATWPPSAAVRQRSIALITFN